MTREDIVKGALELCRVIYPGQTPSADDSARLVRALDTVLDELQTRAILFSQERVATVNYAGGSATVTFATDFGRDPAVNLVGSDGGETPVRVIGLREWAGIPDKTAIGAAPSHLYIDGEGVGHVYPVPTSSGSLKVYYNREIAASQAAQFPQLPERWGSALQYAVAVEVSVPYGVPRERRAELEAIWEKKLRLLTGDDVNKGGVLEVTVDD